MTRFQRRVLSVCCALFACPILPVAIHAQSTFGDIRGTTRDPAGLAVPQSAVTLKNLDENTTRSTLADGNGSYLFENLKPGHYEIAALKEGFTKSPTITVELAARQSARIDLPLSLAQVTQTVNVEVAAEQINTENSTVGDTRGNEQLVEMPLNFRAQTTSPLASLAFRRMWLRTARAIFR